MVNLSHVTPQMYSVIVLNVPPRMFIDASPVMFTAWSWKLLSSVILDDVRVHSRIFCELLLQGGLFMFMHSWKGREL